MTDQKFLLVPKNRKSAIHLLRNAVIETPMFGRTESKEVACGVPLDIAGWTSRVTTQAHLVTCKECYAIANPPKPSIA